MICLILLPFFNYSQEYLCEVKRLDKSQRVVEKYNILIEPDDDGGAITWPQLGDIKYSFGIELEGNAEDDYYFWSELSQNSTSLVSSDLTGLRSRISEFESILFTQYIKLKCWCRKVEE